MVNFANPIVLSAAVSAGVTTAHAVGHYAAGNAESFEEAGVNTAGIAVLIASFVASYIVLTQPGVIIA